MAETALSLPRRGKSSKRHSICIWRPPLSGRRSRPSLLGMRAVSCVSSMTHPWSPVTSSGRMKVQTQPVRSWMTLRAIFVLGKLPSMALHRQRQRGGPASGQSLATGHSKRRTRMLPSLHQRMQRQAKAKRLPRAKRTRDGSI